jgi:hypothetical protein
LEAENIEQGTRNVELRMRGEGTSFLVHYFLRLKASRLNNKEIGIGVYGIENLYDSIFFTFIAR